MRYNKPLCFAAAMLPGLAMADAGDFDYVEGAYMQGETSEVDVDGFGARASYEFYDRFLAVASYRDLDQEENTPFSDLGLSAHSLGLGYIFGRNETASVYGTASYTEQEISGNIGGVPLSIDEEGAQLELGVRMNLSPQAELYIAGEYIDLGQDDEETMSTVGLVFEFLPSFSGTLSYSRASDDNLLGLGLRFNF